MHKKNLPILKERAGHARSLCGSQAVIVLKSTLDPMALRPCL